jgi:nucleoporin NUP159
MKANSLQSLGYNTFAGETKVKLLPEPWPTDALPSSTSSLFSITSKRGLVAAAGPNSLVIAETSAVRAAFDDPKQPAENNIKPFTPALTLPVPRLSQVAFTSEGTYLVICAENGGGLAVYDTQSILSGNKESAFQIATEGVSVRALAPNPAPELAHLVAVVLTGGQLMIANLQERKFITGNHKSLLLKDGVSCVSWSVKGKQLVAGLGDGNAFQMDQMGVPKAIIRQPPDVKPNHHGKCLVSSILRSRNHS